MDPLFCHGRRFTTILTAALGSYDHKRQSIHAAGQAINGSVRWDAKAIRLK
jgi:hypothetical protein